MAYDDTDPDADGVVEADVDNAATTTEHVSSRTRGESYTVYMSSGGTTYAYSDGHRVTADFSGGDPGKVIKDAIESFPGTNDAHHEGRIHLRAQTFDGIQTQIPLYGHTHITGESGHGDGSGGTVLKAGDNFNDWVISYGPFDNDAYFGKLSGFVVEGNKANNSSATGIKSDNSGTANPNDLHVDGVSVFRSAGHGWNLWSWGYYLNQTLGENCVGDGYNLDGSRLTMTQAYGALNGGRGLYSKCGRSNIEIDVSSNTDHGAFLDVGHDDSKLVLSAAGHSGSDSLRMQNANSNIILLPAIRNSSIGIRLSNSDANRIAYPPSPGNEPTTRVLTQNGSERNAVNGKMIDPPTHSLGGSDTNIQLDPAPVEKYPFFVDAGGSVSELEGVTWSADTSSIAIDGTTIIIIHTGGENVTLSHDDSTGSSRELLNKSGSNDTLSANGEMAAYEYDSQSAKWRQKWIHN